MTRRQRPARRHLRPMPPHAIVRGHRFWNLTGYSTRDLIAYVLAAFRACGIKRPKRVVFSASPIWSRGCAETTKDTPGAALSIAVAPPSKFTYRRLARLLVHECAHLRGMDHDDMEGDDELLYSEGPLPGWARGLKVRYVRRAPNQIDHLQG